ncbi:MAG TPA: DMT family transporter [Candidatus Norongarragalinales archaeon]|nr:DMT family transporter [Candidatus Norongarragalinales archaeon]
MPELFYAFLVPFAFAFQVVVEKLILNRISVYTSLFYEYLFAIALIFASTLALSNLVFPTGFILLLIALASVIGAASIIFYYKALQSSNQVSLIAAVSGSYILFTVAFSIFFLGEPFLPNYYLAIPLILASLALLSLKKERKIVLTDPSVALALLGSVGWGAYYTISKPVSQAMTSYSATLFLEIGVLSGIIFYILATKKKLDLKTPEKTLPLLAFMAFLFAVGAIAVNISIVLVGVSLTILIAAVSPAITTVSAFVFLKERLTSWQYLGVMLMVASMVVLSF